jgi:hypothetical protein
MYGKNLQNICITEIAVIYLEKQLLQNKYYGLST